MTHPLSIVAAFQGEGRPKRGFGQVSSIGVHDPCAIQGFIKITRERSVNSPSTVRSTSS